MAEFEAKSLLNGAELIVEGRADSEPDGDEDSAVDIETCPTCEGSGMVDGEPCPDCEGSGSRAESVELEKRRRDRENLKGSLEHRGFETGELEIRSTTDGKLRFSGYASITETPYQVGRFEETFARGAFKRSLGEDPDVVLLVNHNGAPLARTKSGTMTLNEDARGLKVTADLEETDPDVRALRPKIERGDLSEMSIAFRATDDEWSERDTKRVVRSATIHKGDVSIVTHGANPATSLGLRELVGVFEERAGARHSAADRAEIEDAIGRLQKLLEGSEPESEPEPSQPDPAALMARSDVDLARAGLEVARARRFRLFGGS